MKLNNSDFFCLYKTSGSLYQAVAPKEVHKRPSTHKKNDLAAEEYLLLACIICTPYGFGHNTIEVSLERKNHALSHRMYIGLNQLQVLDESRVLRASEASMHEKCSSLRQHNTAFQTLEIFPAPGCRQCL